MGPHEEEVGEAVGDFVLLRSDGAYAYQLAVVVDDAEMAITDVLRGADLIDSTCRQIHLQRALGYATPRYAHAPLVVGGDGEKLNKRHGAPDLGALRESGVPASRVLAALARSLCLVPDHVTSVSARSLVADFDLSAVPTAAAVLDLAGLREADA